MSRETFQSNSICYLDTVNRDGMSRMLLKVAITYFKRAIINTHFRKLEDLVARMNRGELIGALEKPEFDEVSREALMDSVKIVICFENYSKAVLLSQDYIIHCVNDQLPDLMKRQKKNPIKVSEYKQQDKIQYDEHRKINRFAYLIDKTIDVGQIMDRKPYREVIALPENVHRLVTAARNHRNNLHFLFAEAFGFGSQTLENHQILVTFVNSTIIPWYNSLVNSTGMGAAHVIKEIVL